jgi:hypothetical protein
VLTGDALRRFSERLLAIYDDSEEQAQHVREYEYYPR